MRGTNIATYELDGKKVYDRHGRGREVRRWLGPRGKAINGTGKQLARLLWDRSRFK